MLWTGRWIIALVGLLLGVLLHKEFLKRVHKGDLPDAVVLLAINGACCVGICAWWWLVHPIAEWTLDGRERLIWLCLGVAFGLPLVGFILYCLWMILKDHHI